MKDMILYTSLYYKELKDKHYLMMKKYLNIPSSRKVMLIKFNRCKVIPKQYYILED